ncbi:MAG: hypothetical protein AAB778_04135 [Patescibacteria group bacterium]
MSFANGKKFSWENINKNKHAKNTPNKYNCKKLKINVSFVKALTKFTLDKIK